MLGNSAPVAGNATRKLKLRMLVEQQFAGHWPTSALTWGNARSGRLQAASRPRESQLERRRARTARPSTPARYRIGGRESRAALTCPSSAQRGC